MVEKSAFYFEIDPQDWISSPDFREVLICRIRIWKEGNSAPGSENYFKSQYSLTHSVQIAH